MAQNPTVPEEWYPLSPSQFLAAATSTALTIPAISPGQPAKSAVHVAILTAINGPMWARFDGQPAVAVTGSEVFNQGDWMVVYGYPAITAIRIIKDATATGLMAIKYYYFRISP